MKKSLKNKILIGVPIIFIVVMLMVTGVVSVILNRQNQRIANTLLQNVFNIIHYTISERQEKLLFDSHQMASLDNMGRKIKYVTESSSYFKYDTLRPTYTKIASVLYGTSTTANVWKANIYNLDGDLMAFTIIEENGSILGCIHNQETIEIASLKPDEELTHESWTKQDSLPAGIEYSFGREIPAREVIHFEIVDNSLCLVAYVPVMGKEYNPATEKIEPKQVGMVVAVQRLGTTFAKKMAELSGTDINIFTSDGLVSGTLAGYKPFDLSRFADVDRDWTLDKQQVTFNEVNLIKGSYFQGILPIYYDSRCVAAIASLYSKATARANTAQIVTLLSIVYLVGIILIVPITLLMVVRGIINPIQRIGSMMREIAHKKDFTKILDIKRRDEIGDLALSFNEMTANLRKTTTSIDNLNREITERKRAEEEIRKFKTISDRASYGTAISDAEGNLLYLNQAFAKMHGYTPEELIGKNLSVFHSEEQIKDVNRLNERLKREGSYTAEEVWHKRKDDTVFPTLMNATVIRDEKGTPLFLSATALDITERKKAEEQQRRLMKDLEELNRIMTGRELRMIELKGEVNKLNEELGRSKPYET